MNLQEQLNFYNLRFLNTDKNTKEISIPNTKEEKVSNDKTIYVSPPLKEEDDISISNPRGKRISYKDDINVPQPLEEKQEVSIMEGATVSLAFDQLMKNSVNQILNAFPDPEFSKKDKRNPKLDNQTYSKYFPSKKLSEEEENKLVPYVAYDLNYKDYEGEKQNGILVKKIEVELEDKQGFLGQLTGADLKNVAQPSSDYYDPDNYVPKKNNVLEENGVFKNITINKGSAFEKENENGFVFKNTKYTRKSDWKTNIESFRMNKYGDIWSIGFIYAIPFDSFDNTSDIETRKRFRIPFQYNPEISESSYQAKYSAISILSRIGELQAYTGSSLSTLEITSRYDVLTNQTSLYGDKKYNTSSWDNYATLINIRRLENLYRSLVFPYANEINISEENKQSYYVRPPMLKVVLGDIFTHPIETNLSFGENGKITSISNISNTTEITDDIYKGKFKTYVATSVNIKKNLQEDKIVMMNGQLSNTASFVVSLSLLEVSQNYSDNSISDFETYYSQAVSNSITDFDYGYENTGS